MELSRRKWPTLELGPLQNWRKRDIVEAFLRRSLLGHRTHTEDHQDPRGTRRGSAVTFLTGVETLDGGDEPTAQGSPPGLVLFPSMIESILSK